MGYQEKLKTQTTKVMKYQGKHKVLILYVYVRMSLQVHFRNETTAISDKGNGIGHKQGD